MAASQMKLTHIPKRSTQHGAFLAGYEVIPPTLKPGQARLERQVYSEEVKKHNETYMECDLPKGSNYGRTISQQTRPEDYHNPTKPTRQGEPAVAGGHHFVGHWKSNHNAGHNLGAIEGAVQHRQHGPSYQALNPPTCVSRGADPPGYHQDYGARGEDPRDKMVAGHPRMPVFKSSLTFGTPKGTAHMPGYQGFLPYNTSNPLVARYEDGADLRSVDKTNLTEQFHVNMVNYAGHAPSNANNDKGGRKGDTITEMGRSFRMPRGNLN